MGLDVQSKNHCDDFEYRSLGDAGQLRGSFRGSVREVSKRLDEIMVDPGAVITDKDDSLLLSRY